MDTELEEFKRSLLRGLRKDLGPQDGDEAFDQHILLAARVHRVARLSQTVKGEGNGWRQFISTFFPDGRNSAEGADLLWNNWRLGLVKDWTPLRGVSVTHGQPQHHWQPDSHGALCIDLESMWDDLEHAVNKLVDAMAADPGFRTTVLQRWHERTWTVRPFGQVQQFPVSNRDTPRVTAYLPIGSTMGAPSVTAWNPPDQTAE